MRNLEPTRASRDIMMTNGVGALPVPPVAGATISVSAEVADVRTLAIVLTDAQGNAIQSRQMVHIVLFLDALGDAFVVTGGSTGIAIAVNGAIQALVAKKSWLAISEPNGTIGLTWTDTGTEVAFLAVILPDGRPVFSTALTNA